MPKKKIPEEPVTTAAATPPEKEKKKMGRPRIEIDKKMFEYFLMSGCTLKTIAGYFAITLGSCSEDTIERFCKREYGQKFAELQAVYKGYCKSEISRKMFEVAMQGDTKMLIWLSKVWLGLSENKTLQSDEEKTSVLHEILDTDDTDDGGDDDGI